jgi:DNA helicase-2/ATP-dependent DNA helicase PcrA
MGEPRPACIAGGLMCWAGTFHGIGARLLREHADQIGLDPASPSTTARTAADLMNLVRHEIGFRRPRSRFPTKGTCLAIYSRASTPKSRWTPCWATPSPGAHVGGRAEGAVRRLCRGQAGQNVLDYDDLLLYWAQMMRRAGAGRGDRRRFDHVLVDEYQDTNRLQASILPR